MRMTKRLAQKINRTTDYQVKMYPNGIWTLGKKRVGK